ncbi:RHS repeat-associated core domain-containing protein [Vibrio sp. TRT 29B02]|uniref:RHS repeat-associated core domain-containing protein n=1 Tax=Vibrio sp. TRT 29B02 TaxID=3418508 RepID=UPI003CFB5FAD
MKQTANGVTTYYISPEYQLELSTDNSGKTVTTMRHRFLADNQAVAEHVKTLIGSEKQIDRTAYFHRDALGTADLITDPNGQVQIERGYTPFGELLASAELQATPMFTNAEMRGFTGHENVGNSSGLINMNARLYDPVIGRFLSADTFVPEPSFSQSYNRYAYVYNNPLKYTDPTGHWVWWAAAMAFFVVSQTFENPVIQMAGMVVGAIAMGYATSGLYAGLGEVAQAAASGATASFSTTYITTGNFGDSVQAGVIGGLSAGITNGLAHGEGSPFNAQTGSLRAALPLAHGVAQGGIHELQGGSFKQGFISGVIGKLGGGIVHANVQTQTLQAGGMIIVSGIAAAASGSNSRDAVMRSAISVITIYLYNDAQAEKDSSRSQMVKRGDGIWQYRDNAAFKAAGLSPDTSNGCSLFKTTFCSLSGTLSGYGGDEVTEALKTAHDTTSTLVELKNLEMPKEIDFGVYIYTFRERYISNNNYCMSVCEQQSFQRNIE